MQEVRLHRAIEREPIQHRPPAFVRVETGDRVYPPVLGSERRVDHRSGDLGCAIAGRSRGDGNGLSVEVELLGVAARRDQNGVAVACRIDAGLDAGLVLRNADRPLRD